MGTNSTFTNEYTEVGEYPITLWLELDGCSDSLTKTLTFKDAFRYFEYNAFSPNGDGINDVYKPYVSGIKSLNFKIYNSWGEKIFEGNQETEGWNGEINGRPAPQGYYAVLVFIQDSKNRRINDSGVIHLIR
jgi:gliding motility-associated-like protein